MRPGMINAFLGGAAGTAAMMLGTSYVVPMMMSMDMDTAAMLSDFFGSSYWFGMAINIFLGVVVFPLFYIYVVVDRLFGSPLLRGLIWGVALWLVADLLVFPVLGTGVFMSNVGGWAAVLASLVAHLLYSGLLGVFAGRRIE